jgi:hypothetical protein
MKKCSYCLKTQSKSEFNKMSHNKDLLHSHCKDCLSHRAKLYRDDHKAELKAASILRRYKLSVEQYNTMIKDCNNCCTICKVELLGTNTDANAPCIDHCHTTNIVRGILCMQCNKGLGLFRDSPESLVNAAQYLLAASHIVKADDNAL